MWLDMAIAMSCGGAGLACGWVIHAIGSLGNAPRSDQDGCSEYQDPWQLDPTPEQITAVAHRLQTYALAMAADVDAHQTRMQAVNNTLIQVDDASHDAVIRAVSDLISANEEMQTQLKEAQNRIHEQTIQIESAEHRAQTDVLTRLPNRRAFDDHIEIRASLGPGRAGTLALLDVDHFKQFNDAYGHRAGDEVLRIVGNILHSRLKSYGLVSRFGGEEFAIILDGIPVENAKSLVERARLAIGERDILFENKRLRVTASVGLAEFSPGQAIHDWIQQTDAALYGAKDAGRDCGCWMDGSLLQRIDIGRKSSTHNLLQTHVQDQSIDALGGDGPAGESRSGKNELSISPELLAVRPEQNPKSVIDLPDEHSLGMHYAQVRQRAQSEIPIAVMAIVCREHAAPSTMTGLLRVTRAALRGVDRIGRRDESTLLICLPSIELPMAEQLGRQICRAAESIGLQWKGVGPRPISIGIVEAESDAKFDALVSRAVQLAEESRDSFTDPIRLDADKPAAAEA